MKKKIFNKIVILTMALFVMVSCFPSVVHKYRIEYSDGTVVERLGYYATLSVVKNSEQKIVNIGCGNGDHEYFCGDIVSLTIVE